MNVIERYPIVWKNSRKGTASDTIKPQTPSVIITIKGKHYKIIKFDNFVSMPAEMLSLSTRGENTLRRNAINTIGELLDQYGRLPVLHGMGETTLIDVQKNLIRLYKDYLTETKQESLLKELEVRL